MRVECLSIRVIPAGEPRSGTLGSPLSSAFAANRAGTRYLGRYIGVYTLAFSLSQMLAPILGLSIYQEYGGDVLWFGCAALGMMSAGIVFAASRR